MRTVDAYADLRRFGKLVLTTADAATRLRTTRSAASRALGRMATQGLVLRVCHGMWSMDPDLDPLVVAEYLTAPLPAYVSLQSALYYHGMISQVPQVTYVASLATTRRTKTSLGTYSIHQLSPEFFGGYKQDATSSARMATPEKALLDVLYLSPARSRLFARLPELELPKRFSARECRRWISKIPARYRRTMVTERLARILDTV